MDDEHSTRRTSRRFDGALDQLMAAHVAVVKALAEVRDNHGPALPAFWTTAQKQEPVWACPVVRTDRWTLVTRASCREAACSGPHREAVVGPVVGSSYQPFSASEDPS